MSADQALDELVREVNASKDRVARHAQEAARDEQSADELTAELCREIDGVVQVAFDTGLAIAPPRRPRAPQPKVRRRPGH